jgi:glycosyltransferase involved in cell wall biosynthesis
MNAATPDTRAGAPCDVTVILTCFNEEASIDAVYEKLDAAMRAQHRSYEIIFVNDGSTDGSLQKLLMLHERDPRVIVIDLERNSGQWPAMTAGINIARGSAIAFIDCDLQLDPADLPRLLDVFDEGYEMTGGRRRSRQDPARRKIISRLGNAFFRMISGGRIEDFGCGLKVFAGDHLHAYDFGPMTPFRPLQVVAAMRNVIEIDIAHFPRQHGKSHWPGRVLWRNFSFAFLGLLQGRIRTAGLWACAAGLLTAAGAFVAWLAGCANAVLPLLLGGILMVQTGILLILQDLLILAQVARRSQPAYLVKHVYRREA